MGDPEPFLLSAFGDEVASDLDAQVQALRQQDIRFLELRSVWGTNVVDLSDADLRRVHDGLTAGGIGISAIASPVGKAPVDSDFDAERRRCRRALEAAHRLGASLVRVFSYFVPGGAYRRYRAEITRRIAAFAADAERAGVTLVLENESYVYGDSAERCLDLIQAVGSAALRFAFDPANFVQVGIRPYAEAWPLLSPYVAHVHIKDAVAVDRGGFSPYPQRVAEERLMDSVRPPGQGDGELRPLLRDLIRQSYRGFLTVEPHLGRRFPDLDGVGRLRAAVAALRLLVSEVDG